MEFKNGVKWTLILCNGIYLASMNFWLTALYAAETAFGSGGSQIIPWAIVINVAIYPIYVVLSVIYSWIHFAKGIYRGALLWNFIPFILAIISSIIFIVLSLLLGRSM